MKTTLIAMVIVSMAVLAHGSDDIVWQTWDSSGWDPNYRETEPADIKPIDFSGLPAGVLPQGARTGEVMTPQGSPNVYGGAQMTGGYQQPYGGYQQQTGGHMGGYSAPQQPQQQPQYMAQHPYQPYRATETQQTAPGENPWWINYVKQLQANNQQPAMNGGPAQPQVESLPPLPRTTTAAPPPTTTTVRTTTTTQPLPPPTTTPIHHWFKIIAKPKTTAPKIHFAVRPKPVTPIVIKPAQVIEPEEPIVQAVPIGNAYPVQFVPQQHYPMQAQPQQHYPIQQQQPYWGGNYGYNPRFQGYNNVNGGYAGQF